MSTTPCPTCGKTIGLPDKLYIAGTICPNPIGHQALAEAPATKPFTGVVTESGGGMVHIMVDRDTDSYPAEGEAVSVASRGIIEPEKPRSSDGNAATQAQPKTDEVELLVAKFIGQVNSNPDTSNYIGREDMAAEQELITAIQRLITEARREELNDLVIGKPAIGPNGEDLGVNTIDHDAIWRRINDRLAELKRSL